MSISVSDRAVKRINEIREEKNVPDNAWLRVGVVGGGCSGLTYDLDFDEEGPKQDQKDKTFNANGIDIVCDMRSFLYLAGTELDYTDGLNGEGFHFQNPNASRTCSCGESFAV